MISVVQITDLHLRERAGETVRGLDTRATFLAVLAHAQRHGPVDALLLTGDIADDGSEGAYAFLREQLAHHPAPVLCVPGNHDDPKRMRAMLGDAPFICGGVVPLGASWRVELLDSHLPGEVGGRLTAPSRALLQSQRAAAGRRFRLLALHHPPVALGSAWLDACALQAPEQLLDHVDDDPQVRAVVWGHAHQRFDGMRHCASLLGTPSSCAQFLPGSADFAIDEERPPAYRRLQLHADGRVDTQVVWVADA